MKDSKYVGRHTPYGYLKVSNDCDQLIIDPVASEVVKTMFQWAAEGAGLNTIAVRLNEIGYAAPSHYKRTLGEITHENLVGDGHWQTRTVGKILRAEVYTGDLAQGVFKIIDHRQVKANADEWTIVRRTVSACIKRKGICSKLYHISDDEFNKYINDLSGNGYIDITMYNNIPCYYANLKSQEFISSKSPMKLLQSCIAVASEAAAKEATSAAFEKS